MPAALDVGCTKRCPLNHTGRRRRSVHYAGHVQGVGFRYTARGIARRYDVRGFVRNLPDGRVHLVVEGPVDQLDGMLDEMDAALAGYIQSKQVETCPATGEFDRFEITF